ncbi:MAG: hypothetical protein ABI877_19195 [Gemmatimonadaceae bacterium]
MLVATLITITPDIARAQVRRRAPAPGDGNRISNAGGPATPRFPYAGSWQGLLTMQGVAPGAGRPEPIAMTFDIADSSKHVYSGATVFIAGASDAGRSPHLKSVTTAHALRWEEKNSGPGFFVYTAQLVTQDSIVGTVKLRDGVLPGPPTGTFVLVRRSPTTTRTR